MKQFALDRQEIDADSPLLDFTSLADEIVEDNGTLRVADYTRLALNLRVYDDAAGAAALVCDARRHGAGLADRIAYSLGGDVPVGDERPVLGYSHGYDVAPYAEIDLDVDVDAATEVQLHGCLYDGGPAGGVYREGTVEVPAGGAEPAARLPIVGSRDIAVACDGPAPAEVVVELLDRSGDVVGEAELGSSTERFAATTTVKAGHSMRAKVVSDASTTESFRYIARVGA